MVACLLSCCSRLQAEAEAAKTEALAERQAAVDERQRVAQEVALTRHEAARRSAKVDEDRQEVQRQAQSLEDLRDQLRVRVTQPALCSVVVNTALSIVVAWVRWDHRVACGLWMSVKWILKSARTS